MDNDILSSIDELFNLATTEDELAYVVQLYEEYQESLNQERDAIDDLLEDVETEDDLEELIEIEEKKTGIETEIEETSTEDEQEIEIIEDEPESEFYAKFYQDGEEEPDIRPGSEEDDWERADDGDLYIWIDKNLIEHHIQRGEPTDPAAEYRQYFDFPEDAITYALEIGAGASYFDVFEVMEENGPIYEVWYVG